MPSHIFSKIVSSLVLIAILQTACANKSPDGPLKTSEAPTEATNNKLIDLNEKKNKTQLVDFCINSLKSFPGVAPDGSLEGLCEDAQKLEGCTSVDGKPIFHFERKGHSKTKGKRILSLSLIHGDEMPSGSVNRAWSDRLRNIEPRNTWRVIPLANPDGYEQKTRYNKRGVDLNRNFPSKDWDEKALSYWKNRTKSDKRRYPGGGPASEPETKCLAKHIMEFKPDFIISVHTPLGVLDFDGPNVGNPNFKPLPWVGLGNFPGSLGRYMWVDHKIPVLTIELKGNKAFKRLEEFDRLQDVTGTVAIQAARVLSRKRKQAGKKSNKTQ